MEASRVRGNCDNPRLPTLSLGLSSVRHIVSQIEAERARVFDSQCESSRDLVKYQSNVKSCDDNYDSPFIATRGAVWHRFAINLGLALSRCIPSVSFGNFALVAVVAGLFAPRMLSYLVIYPFCRLVFGTLYPAYASYKAVRTKNLKEYVKWMMYWIVFALFTCMETFTDVFLSWFPFYYEVKIVLVLWLLSPATKGSSILYRKFVHPALCRREQEIDEYIAKAKDQGYHTVLNLGTKGVNYATTVIMQTAIKGGGGLVQQIRKSYSLSDLSECEPQEKNDETDDVITEPRLLRRNVKTGYRRSASESNSRSPLYFPEVDVDVRAARHRADEPDFSHIKSSEDISSGYSSADNSGSLTRAGSTGAARGRSSIRNTRTTVTTIKRPHAAEENEVIIEELRDDDSFDYANMPPLLNLPPNLYLSHTSPPFIYQYVGEEIKIIKVLGDNSLNSNFNIETNNSDQQNQNEKIAKDVSSESELVGKEFKVNEKPELTRIIDNPPTQSQFVDHTNILTRTHDDQIYDDKELDVELENIDNTNKKRDTVTENKDDVLIINEVEHDFKNKNETDTIVNNENVKESDLESTSIDASVYDNESAESDDEASFGTPEDSPKIKRKSPKGKYGKSKAPPPPPTTVDKGDINKNKNIDKEPVKRVVAIEEKETLKEIISKLPGINFEDTGNKKGLNVINPIFENKRRHKSKSPNRRHPKGSSSGIGKLLQLPGKLAFWHKSDDKIKDNSSISSGNESRRSSTVEEIKNSTSIDNLTTFTNIYNNKEVADDQISFKDASEYIEIENEALSHDIIEKSDALQKLIDAKLESHPEYKILTLHEELPTLSKSTDV